MHLAYQQLLQDHPDLAGRIAEMPLRVFSGKEHPVPGTRAVFFCYRLPAKDAKSGAWEDEAGFTRWYLYDLETGEIEEDATRIWPVIRCGPEAPRRTIAEEKKLTEIRREMDKHVTNTYLKRVQAPVGVKATLLAWMELI
jgi:hypothetical protein